jgi:hypothetical protein
MIFDLQSLLSDAQLITATAPSTNYYDKLAAKVFFGRGVPIPLMCQVTQTMLAAGAATLTVSVETDDNAAFSSVLTIFTTPAIPKATLVAGYQIPLLFGLHGINDVERYLRIQYTVATGPFTQGAISCGIPLGKNIQSTNWL